MGLFRRWYHLILSPPIVGEETRGEASDVGAITFRGGEFFSLFFFPRKLRFVLGDETQGYCLTKKIGLKLLDRLAQSFPIQPDVLMGR